MKKFIFSALTFFMLSTVAVFAQDAGQVTQDPDRAADAGQEQRTEVSLQDLPPAINNTLQEEFDDWTPTASYMMTDEEEGEHYAVDLQKDDETKTVKFDRQGNKIDKEK